MGLSISLLLLLLVVVLWQVYSQIEAFSTAGSTQDASGSMVPTQDASSSVVSSSSQRRTFSPEEIIAALSGVQLTESSLSAAAPAPSAAAPTPTPEMTKELEERLAKRISSQLKSELLSKRATEHPVDTKYAACELSPSDAEAQGAEYTEAKPGFNINDYVRKDSIPCWGCSLPPA